MDCAFLACPACTTLHQVQTCLPNLLINLWWLHCKIITGLIPAGRKRFLETAHSRWWKIFAVLAKMFGPPPRACLRKRNLSAWT